MLDKHKISFQMFKIIYQNDHHVKEETIIYGLTVFHFSLLLVKIHTFIYFEIIMQYFNNIQ